MPAIDKSVSAEEMNSAPLSCLPDESVPSIIAKSSNNSCDDIGEDSRDHHGINSVTGEIASTRANLQQSNLGASLVNSPRRNLQVLAVLVVCMFLLSLCCCNYVSFNIVPPIWEVQL